MTKRNDHPDAVRVTRMTSSGAHYRSVTPSLVWTALLTMIISACGIDKAAFTPMLEANELVGRITLEHRSYNLATDSPYDTAQLHPTIISGTGEVIDDSVIYSVDNAKVVTVSPTGQLQATGAGTTVIRASVSRHGGTRTDTAVVSVIAGTPAAFVARLAIEPNPGDSAKHAADGGAKTMRLVRLDSANGTMTTLGVTLRSSDTLIATIALSGRNVRVTPRRPGRVYLHISTYAYGKSIHDSLSFLVGWPVEATFSTYTQFRKGTTQEFLNFYPGRLILGVGACVVWSNPNGDYDLDVVFDDPSVAETSDKCFNHFGEPNETGNVLPFRLVYDEAGVITMPFPFRGRSFSRAGAYTFRSAIHGTTGTIIVCDEADDSSCSPENYQWETVKE